MEKRKTVVIILLVLAGVLVGAGILYGKLAENYKPEQLQTQPVNSEEQEVTDTSSTEEFYQETTETTAPEVKLVPDFTAYDTEGNAVKLLSFFGKPIVLNFWASWCGPCKMEMPGFQNQYELQGQNIQFLMVNMTGGRETVESASSFLENQGYTFPALFDIEGSAAYAYNVRSLPTTYFIGADGALVASAVGAISEDTLKQGIEKIQ